jgi:sulfur transfer protein SufE
LQLSKHLVPMRSNGLRSMVNRIQQLAAENA